MANTIGERIERYYARADNEFKSPAQRLKAIIDKMTADLDRYRANPNALPGIVQSRVEMITELYGIYATLAHLEPLDVWYEINKRISDACLIQGGEDIALIYLPLRANLPPYKSTKMALIDLCGFNFESAYDYKLHGDIAE